jgi:hypothetical protein
MGRMLIGMDLVEQIMSKIIINIARGITIVCIRKIMYLPGTLHPRSFHRGMVPKCELRLDRLIHLLGHILLLTILLLKIETQIQAKAMNDPLQPENASSKNSSRPNNLLCQPLKPSSRPLSSRYELKIARRGLVVSQRTYVGCWTGMRIL